MRRASWWKCRENLYQSELYYTLIPLSVPLAFAWVGLAPGFADAPSRLALRGETAPSGRPPHPSRTAPHPRHLILLHLIEIPHSLYPFPPC